MPWNNIQNYFMIIFYFTNDCQMHYIFDIEYNVCTLHT